MIRKIARNHESDVRNVSRYPLQAAIPRAGRIGGALRVDGSRHRQRQKGDQETAKCIHDVRMGPFRVRT
jgi:hypothetical protein